VHCALWLAFVLIPMLVSASLCFCAPTHWHFSWFCLAFQICIASPPFFGFAQVWENWKVFQVLIPIFQ
jgi:hypothetical protein